MTAVCRTLSSVWPPARRQRAQPTSQSIPRSRMPELRAFSMTEGVTEGVRGHDPFHGSFGLYLEALNRPDLEGVMASISVTPSDDP